MPDRELDGYLELTPGKTMAAARSLGESLDSQHGANQAYGAIHLKSFKFGASRHSSVAGSEDGKLDVRDFAKLLKAEQKNYEAGSERSEFGFTVAKEFDASSPFLYRAYCSNSCKPKRPQFNAFSDAVVSLRKTGADSDKPSDYLVFRFREVAVTGYTFKIDGPEPPQETVVFKALYCKMEFYPQRADGTLEKQSIWREWDLRPNTAGSS